MFFQRKEQRRYHRIFSFNIRSTIRIYYCFVRLYYEEDQELYELDVFDSKPHFSDGTRKYLHESTPIDEWDGEVFDDYKKPIELARKIIDQHEQKDRLARSIQHAGGWFELEPKREEKGNMIQIHDYEHQADKRRKDLYLSDISQLDSLSPQERAKWIKDHPEIKEQYKAYRYGVV